VSDLKGIQRAANGDATWFREHPQRSYRIRRATAAEIKLRRAAHDMEKIPPGFRVFAAVRQFEPGSRATALVLGGANYDTTDACEAKCAALFELAVSRGSTIH
jgi:hypothetical protein